MPYKNNEDKLRYQREYQRKWYRERREQFFDGKKCVECGATDDLCLDHRDPADKLASCIWSWTQKRREAEIAKCDVRCQTCHKRRHGLEQRRHGLGRYQAGCRCEVCRAAKSAAMKRETRRSGKQTNRTPRP